MKHTHTHTHNSVTSLASFKSQNLGENDKNLNNVEVPAGTGRFTASFLPSKCVSISWTVGADAEVTGDFKGMLSSLKCSTSVFPILVLLSLIKPWTV